MVLNADAMCFLEKFLHRGPAHPDGSADGPSAGGSLPGPAVLDTRTSRFL